MPYLQTLLLMIGSTALGICLGGFGLAYLAEKVILRPRPGDMGMGVYLIFWFGIFVGAAVGFLIAFRKMMRSGIRPWNRATWAAVAIGSALGCLFAQTAPYGFFGGITKVWWGTLVVTAAAGTLGGTAGTMLRSMRKQSTPLLVQKAKLKKKKRHIGGVK